MAFQNLRIGILREEKNTLIGKVGFIKPLVVMSGKKLNMTTPWL